MSPFLPIIILCFFLCSGCFCHFPDKVYIDRQFLYDIDKEFRAEAKSGADRSDVYNHIWKRNFFELIYLTSRGDHKAIDVSILLIGQHSEPVGRFEQFKLFALPTVKTDSVYFWEAIEKMEPKIQFMALYRLYGDYFPKEKVERYLDNHPIVRKLFHEYEQEILKQSTKANNETNK
jgi:hypothetical protein